MEAGEFSWASSPVWPCLTADGTPPLREAMTGLPQAAASR